MRGKHFLVPGLCPGTIYDLRLCLNTAFYTIISTGTKSSLPMSCRALEYLQGIEAEPRNDLPIPGQSPGTRRRK